MDQSDIGAFELKGTEAASVTALFRISAYKLFAGTSTSSSVLLQTLSRALRSLPSAVPHGSGQLRSHLPALTAIARRTEVYFSEDDVALKVAAWLARASRLGTPRLDELTREDLETLASNERLVGIDVTGVYGAHELTGMRGHGYWVANQRVSSDVLLSMVYPFDPAWRGLVHGPGRGMWTLPDDYPRRVGDAVYQAVPELHREGR